MSEKYTDINNREINSRTNATLEVIRDAIARNNSLDASSISLNRIAEYLEMLTKRVSNLIDVVNENMQVAHSDRVYVAHSLEKLNQTLEKGLNLTKVDADEHDE